MVNWKLRLKRMALVWVRMWRIYSGEPYSLVLCAVFFSILILQFILTYFLLIKNVNISIDTANALFFLSIPFWLLIGYYLTSKAMDYLDMHGW